MMAIGTRACPHFRNDDKNPPPIFSQFRKLLIELKVDSRVEYQK